MTSGVAFGTYQPRYVAYCVAQGRDPDAQLAHDSEAWPGGCMCGFMLWIGERWNEWEKLFGKRPIKGPDVHAAFDKWLNGILTAPTARKGEEVTQGEAALHHPAPECEGVIAARERLEPEGPLMSARSPAKLAGRTKRRDAGESPGKNMDLWPR